MRFHKRKIHQLPRFTIRQIMKKHYKFDKESHIFIDFKQAYDSIDREQLWIVLKNFRLLKKLVKVIKNCNSNITGIIRFLRWESKEFEIKSGLRLRDALFPIIFNITLKRE